MDRTLPPVTFTPEEAAAAAIALAAGPGGPYEGAARAALDKVLTALDPEGREQIVALAARVRREPALRRRSAAHPAGRARRPAAAVLVPPAGVEERLAPVVHLRSVR